MGQTLTVDSRLADDAPDGDQQKYPIKYASVCLFLCSIKLQDCAPATLYHTTPDTWLRESFYSVDSMSSPMLVTNGPFLLRATYWCDAGSAELYQLCTV